MSNKLPAVTSKQMIKILEKKGFLFSRQNGSHAIYKNKDNVRVTVPIHGKKDIAIGTLSQILDDAKITTEELKSLL
jgi:predicted RNA binding protein YcfA (HicA-like mRNA interferase family)